MHAAQPCQCQPYGAGAVWRAAGEHADFSAVETERFHHGRHLLRIERREGGREGERRLDDATLWMP
jgi:hypothetical protein